MIRSTKALSAAALAAVFATAFTVAPSPLAPDEAVDRTPDATRVWTGEAAMISNVGVYREGEFIYQDYLYDDHGANTDGINHTDAPLGAGVRGSDPTNPRTGSSGGQIRHAGDFFYAAESGGYYLNVADLVEFRVTEDGDDLHYLLRMGALTEPDQAVVGVCIDQDGKQGTGLVDWPLGAHLSDPLGCDSFLTVHGTDTQVTDATGATSSLASLGGETVVDLERNTIGVRVPRSLGNPAGATWRYYVASGLWNADAGTWLDVPALPSSPGTSQVNGGSPTAPELWDLLSNNDEPNSYWREERQADELAQGNITKHFVDVDFDRMHSGVNDGDPELTGVVDRIYVAAHPMAVNEGITFQTVALGPRNYVYHGDYQPYAVVIPSTYYQQLAHDVSTQLPLDVCLHPLNGNHHVEIYYMEVEQSPNYVAGVSGTHRANGYYGFDEFESRIDRQNVIYTCGNGRGEGVGFTGGSGMVDAQEVTDDVRARYAVDEDRTTLHGISLGAIGTWHMGTQSPDEYSALLPSIFTGSTGSLTNLYNLPTFLTIGTFDQFGQGAQGDGVANTMEDLGNEYLYYHQIGRFHELSLGDEALPISEPLFMSRERVTNPARVKYLLDESRSNSAIPFDGSMYWVSELTAADGDDGSIDVTSLARADELPTDQVIIDGLYENVDEGHTARMRGLFRLNPDEFEAMWRLEDYQPDWVELNLDIVHTVLSRPEVSNGFDVTSGDLARYALDLERMLIDPTAPIDGEVTSDVEVTVVLLGTFDSDVTVTVDGEPVEVLVTDGGVEIRVPVGTHRVQVGSGG